jgi:hypothetical protein
VVPLPLTREAILFLFLRLPVSRPVGNAAQESVIDQQTPEDEIRYASSGIFVPLGTGIRVILPSPSRKTAMFLLVDMFGDPSYIEMLEKLQFY